MHFKWDPSTAGQTNHRSQAELHYPHRKACPICVHEVTKSKF